MKSADNGGKGGLLPVVASSTVAFDALVADHTRVSAMHGVATRCVSAPRAKH